VKKKKFVYSTWQKMKRFLITDDSGEDLQPKKLQTTQVEQEIIFQEIPTDVTYKIVLLCDVIVTHILRFVCKFTHQISHNYGSRQKKMFFNNIETGTWIFGLAAQQGNLKVLKWMKECLPIIFSLQKNNYYHSAASGGHLEVLKWARDSDCPWDSRTCSEATKNGHFEALRAALARNIKMGQRKLLSLG
jgi:hypothetical protein